MKRKVKVLNYWLLYNAVLQVIEAANEVVDSVDQDELAKFFSQRIDPEDEETEVCIHVNLNLFFLFFKNSWNPFDL